MEKRREKEKTKEGNRGRGRGRGRNRGRRRIGVGSLQERVFGRDTDAKKDKIGTSGQCQTLHRIQNTLFSWHGICEVYDTQNFYCR